MLHANKPVKHLEVDMFSSKGGGVVFFLVYDKMQACKSPNGDMMIALSVVFLFLLTSFQTVSSIPAVSFF